LRQAVLLHAIELDRYEQWHGGSLVVIQATACSSISPPQNDGVTMNNE